MFSLFSALAVLSKVNAQGYPIYGDYLVGNLPENFPENPYAQAPQPLMESRAPGDGSIPSLKELAMLQGEPPAYDPRYPASADGYFVPVWVNEGEELPQVGGQYQWVDSMAEEQPWAPPYNGYNYNDQLPLQEATPGIAFPPNDFPFVPAGDQQAPAGDQPAPVAPPFYYSQ